MSRCGPSGTSGAEMRTESFGSRNGCRLADAQEGTIVILGHRSVAHLDGRLYTETGAIVVAGEGARLDAGLDLEAGAIVVAGESAGLDAGLDLEAGAIVVAGEGTRLDAGLDLQSRFRRGLHVGRLFPFFLVANPEIAGGVPRADDANRPIVRGRFALEYD
jgi:hypothetical protein